MLCPLALRTIKRKNWQSIFLIIICILASVLLKLTWGSAHSSLSLSLSLSNSLSLELSLELSLKLSNSQTLSNSGFILLVGNYHGISHYFYSLNMWIFRTMKQLSLLTMIWESVDKYKMYLLIVLFSTPPSLCDLAILNLKRSTCREGPIMGPKKKNKYPIFGHVTFKMKNTLDTLYVDFLPFLKVHR